MSRLTDEELDHLCSEGQGRSVIRVATELRSRRAADLTAEEREALSWVRDTLRSRHAMAAPTPRALAAIDRLLGAKP